MSLRLLSVVHLWLAFSISPKGVYFPNKVPLRKTKFLFATGYHMEIISGLGMGAGIHFSFPTIGPHFMQTSAEIVPATSTSVSVSELGSC